MVVGLLATWAGLVGALVLVAGGLLLASRAARDWLRAHAAAVQAPRGRECIGGGVSDEPIVVYRHAPWCRVRQGEPCCAGRWVAVVRLPDGGKLRESFRSHGAARSWQQRTERAVQRGEYAD